MHKWKSVNNALVAWVNHKAKWWQFWYLDTPTACIAVLVYPAILAMPMLPFNPKAYGAVASDIALVGLGIMLYAYTIAMLRAEGIHDGWGLVVRLLTAACESWEKAELNRARRRAFFGRIKASLWPK
jgi:hypothetical protein